jgi:hypothetical protein
MAEQQEKSNIDIAVNTFLGGIDTDTNLLKYSPTKYLSANNIRIVSQTGNSTGCVETAKGTNLVFELPNIPQTTYETGGEDGTIIIPAQTNFKIIGWCNINNLIVIFTTTTDGYGQLWKCSINSNETLTNPILVYNRDLGFSVDKRIKAYARYENSTTIRVYFIDDLNQLRSINIVEDINAIKVRTIDYNPKVYLREPTVKEIMNGGNLANGAYSYFYNLISKDGTITNYSNTTHPINLLNGSITGNYQEYPAIAEQFKDEEENLESKNRIESLSEKSIEVIFNNLDKDYEYIQVGYIFWSDKDEPNIFLSDPKKIVNNKLVFVHSGLETFFQPITTNEYNTLNNVFYKPKTMASKGNTLYVGNLENQNFDVNYDARAYRYNDSGESKIYNRNNALEATITNNFPTNLTLDAINKFNNESDSNWSSNQYNLNLTGSELGGSGPNVDYRFITKYITSDFGDDLTTLYNQVYSAGIPFVKSPIDSTTKSYSDYKSPYLAKDFAGYARGEVYRFGIVFYNDKMQPSYVKWVGDIKMPNFSDPDFELYPSGQSGVFSLKALGVQMDITVPNSIASQVKAFRIVRVERDKNNRTRLGTGITGGYTEATSLIRTLLNGSQSQRAAFLSQYIWELIALFLRPTISNLDNFVPLSNVFDFLTGSDNIFDFLQEQVQGRLLKFFNTNSIGGTIVNGPNMAIQILKGEVSLIGVVISNLSSKVFGQASGVGSLLQTPGIMNLFDSGSLIERLIGNILPELKEIFEIKIAGVGEKIKFPQGSCKDSQEAYIISPIITANDYAFRTGDYLRKVYEYNTIEAKSTIVYHKDENTGIFNKTFNTAAYRKWYKGTLATTNDKYIIQYENYLTPGEILHPNIFNGSSSQQDIYINAYLGLNETNIFSGVGLMLIDLYARRHQVMGIGDVKHFVKVNNNFTTSTPITRWILDKQSNTQTGPFDSPTKFLESPELGLPPNDSQWDSSSTDSIRNPRILDEPGDLIVSYERYITNQYGGDSYEARSVNEYISCSPIYIIKDIADKLVNGTTNKYRVDVWQGDTYVGVFDAINYSYYFDQFPGYDKARAIKKGLAEIFPCEAPINFNWRIGKHFANSTDIASLNNTEKRIKRRSKTIFKFQRRGISEGKVKELLASNRTEFEETFYNDVSNQQNNAYKYFPNPLIDKFIPNNNNRIFKSLPKSDGELVDNWKIFKPFDFIDVEGDLGDINDLVSYKDKLFFYQTNGIGIVASGEKQSITDNKDNSIQLSSVVPLSRYDYLSRITGVGHRFATCNTDSSVYHFDVFRKKLYELSEQGLVPISDMTSTNSLMNSLINNNIYEDSTTNPIDGAGIHLEFYPEYSLLLLTFNNYNRTTQINRLDKTLAYNTLLKQFESYHDFKPGSYLRANNLLLSAKDNKGYTHFKGGYNNIYDSPVESNIKIVTNTNPEINKVFDNMLLYINGVDTITKIKCENQFQNTNNQTLTISNGLYSNPTNLIKKREGRWYLDIPRDATTPSIATTIKPRMRGNYIISTLTWDSNNEFKLFDILTKYRIFNR